MTKGTKVVCLMCHKIFILDYRRGVNYSEKTGRGKYCSRECYYKSRKGKRVSIKTEFNSQNISWDKHPRFKTGKWSYHKFIKKKCSMCGKTNNLFVHHIDENRDNNINNLKTVCAKCHRLLHPMKFYGNQYVKINN